MREFDTDAFIERAAICEFCAGMTRFEAETAAAQAQGVARWEAIKILEAEDENRGGNTGRCANTNATLAGERGADDLPELQQSPEEENGSMPEREPEAGRAGVELLALRTQRRGVL